MTSVDVGELVERYVGAWVEPDPARRRDAITRTWTEDGAQVLYPPVEVREAAAALGISHSTLEVHGYDELEQRVARAYVEFVESGEYTFRAAGEAVRLHDVVKFRWEMVPVAGGSAVGGGTDVFLLAEDGRIRVDYQFPDP